MRKRRRIAKFERMYILNDSMQCSTQIAMWNHPSIGSKLLNSSGHLRKIIRQFKIHLRHKKQEELPDLTDLPNKQNFALLYNLFSTLSQDVG